MASVSSKAASAAERWRRGAAVGCRTESGQEETVEYFLHSGLSRQHSTTYVDSAYAA
jgi:hypothetical protein